MLNEQDTEDSAELDLKERMSIDSTASSVFYSRAEQNNAAHSFFKYYFKDNSANGRDEDEEKATGETTFSFMDKFSDSEITTGEEGSLTALAVKIAAESKTHLELLNKTSENLEQLFKDINYQNLRTSKKDSGPQENVFESLMAGFKSKKSELLNLNSIISQLPPQENNKNENSFLSTVLNEEIILACSEIFEQIKISSDREIKLNKSFIPTSNSNVDSSSLKKTIAPDDKKILEENKLLALTLKELSGAKKMPYTFPNFPSNNPPEFYVAQNAEIRAKLSSPTKDGRDLLAGKDLLKELLQEKTKAGEIYEELLQRHPDKTKDFYKILKGELINDEEKPTAKHAPSYDLFDLENDDNDEGLSNIFSINDLPTTPQQERIASVNSGSSMTTAMSDLTLSTKERTASVDSSYSLHNSTSSQTIASPSRDINEPHRESPETDTSHNSSSGGYKKPEPHEFITLNDKLSRLKSKYVPWSDKIKHTNFISYSISDDLVSTFSITSEERPHTKDGYYQKDHTTAYCALLVAAINSIPAVARSRDLPRSVEGIINLMLPQSHNNFDTDEDFDQERRELVAKLKFNDNDDKSKVNNLLKIHNLRLANNSVCETVNDFLIEMNLDEWASFEQDGKNRATRDEGGAIQYMIGLNKTFNLAQNANAVYADPKLAERTLESLKQDLPLTSADSAYLKVSGLSEKALQEKEEEPLDITMSDPDSIIKTLSKNFFAIFDLSYPHLKQSKAVANIAGEQQDQYMIKVATLLMERHFKILGVVNNSTLVGIEDQVTGKDPFAKLAEKFLEEFFQEPVETSKPPRQTSPDTTPENWNLAPNSSRSLISGDTTPHQELSEKTISTPDSTSNSQESFRTLFSKLILDTNSHPVETISSPLRTEEIFEHNKKLLTELLTGTLRETSIKANKIITGYRRDTPPISEEPEKLRDEDHPTTHASPKLFLNLKHASPKEPDHTHL